jgi:hypothetical protein
VVAVKGSLELNANACVVEKLVTTVAYKLLKIAARQCIASADRLVRDPQPDNRRHLGHDGPVRARVSHRTFRRRAVTAARAVHPCFDGSSASNLWRLTDDEEAHQVDAWRCEDVLISVRAGLLCASP